jgi:hypothetical protein
MKKLVILSLIAAIVAMPIAAQAEEKAMEAAPAAGHAAAKKVELKDGSWAQIEGDSVKVSKDGGKTWMAAPDGTWEAKDGAKITTKGGKEVK